MPGRIDHVILLTMENRSFDHFLGALRLAGRTDVEGLPDPLPSLPDSHGNQVQSFPLDGKPIPNADVPHGWADMHNDYNAGAMDDFLKVYQSAHGSLSGDPANWPMGFYTGDTLRALYELSRNFCVCDHWHASVLSSTWPNRKYLMSGKRDGDRDTGNVPPFPPGFATTPIFNFLEDQLNNRVSNRNITWRSYVSDVPFLAFWYEFAAAHIDDFEPVGRFAEDCRANTLPDISIIDPPFLTASDHAPFDPKLGEKFIALIVDALTTSESWDSSALFILYDEAGGFYDHLRPPTAPDAGSTEDDPVGFRVPAIIVSPWVKPRSVCHTFFEHTAVLKAIASNWDVAFPDTDFGIRWNLSKDPMKECFNFNQSPIKRGIYTGAPYAELDWASGIHDTLTSPARDLEAALERVLILPQLKALDQRASVYGNLAALEQSVVSMKRSSAVMG